MSDSPYIINVTEENFTEVVIEGSKKQPILVDYWAEWCNPCQMLIPIVSKLAEEYDGKFILAKINTDEQQQLAQKNGVKSLPTVKLYKDGVAVDEFMGALPEGEVRAFLDKHIAATPNSSYDQGIQAQANGDAELALALFNQALSEDPDNAQLKKDIAQVFAEDDNFDSALALINSLSAQQQTATGAKELLTKINMQQRLDKAPPTDELEQRMSSDDTDLEAYMLLSDAYAASDRTEDSLTLLLDVMRKDRTFNDDAGRKGLLNLFELLGSEHPLTKTFRRKMFSLMH